MNGVWIHSANEMPDADETVIVFNPPENEPVWFGYFDGDRWRDINGDRFLAQPTHWMPLPEPPKEEGRAA